MQSYLYTHKSLIIGDDGGIHENIFTHIYILYCDLSAARCLGLRPRLSLPSISERFRSLVAHLHDSDNFGVRRVLLSKLKRSDTSPQPLSLQMLIRLLRKLGPRGAKIGRRTHCIGYVHVVLFMFCVITPEQHPASSESTVLRAYGRRFHSSFISWAGAPMMD